MFYFVSRWHARSCMVISCTDNHLCIIYFSALSIYQHQYFISVYVTLICTQFAFLSLYYKTGYEIRRNNSRNHHRKIIYFVKIILQKMENFWKMAKIISFRAPVLRFGTRSDLILLLLCDSTFYQGLSCSKHGKISKLWRKIILEKMENFWRTLKIWDENAATGTCFILMNLPAIKKH